jgi:hypothetical protein
MAEQSLTKTDRSIVIFRAALLQSISMQTLLTCRIHSEAELAHQIEMARIRSAATPLAVEPATA